MCEATHNNFGTLNFLQKDLENVILISTLYNYFLDVCYNKYNVQSSGATKLFYSLILARNQ